MMASSDSAIGFAWGERRRGRNRQPERGGSVLIALMAVLVLVTFGGLAIVSGRRDTVSPSRRDERIARRAAEAGVEAAVDWLGRRCPAPEALAAVGLADGSGFTLVPDVPGNGAAPGDPDALLAPALDASYAVWLRALPDGPGVVIRSVGRAAGRQALIEVRARLEVGCKGVKVLAWREGT